MRQADDSTPSQRMRAATQHSAQAALFTARIYCKEIRSLASRESSSAIKRYSFHSYYISPVYIARVEKGKFRMLRSIETLRITPSTTDQGFYFTSKPSGGLGTLRNPRYLTRSFAVILTWPPIVLYLPRDSHSLSTTLWLTARLFDALSYHERWNVPLRRPKQSHLFDERHKRLRHTLLHHQPKRLHLPIHTDFTLRPESKLDRTIIEIPFPSQISAFTCSRLIVDVQVLLST